MPIGRYGGVPIKLAERPVHFANTIGKFCFLQRSFSGPTNFRKISVCDLRSIIFKFIISLISQY